MGFKFDLGDSVNLKGSDEHGEVIARAEYTDSNHMYLVRYQAGDGRLVEAWWSVTALVYREE